MDLMSSDPQFAALVTRMRETARVAEERDAARIAALPVGVCHRCEGSGWISVENRVHKCWKCSAPPDTHADGVPYEFQAVTLENYDGREGQRTALQRAQQFVDEPSRDLYLCGGVGAGKTRMACALINSYVRKQRTGYFMRVPMVLYQFQPGRDADEVRELERRLFTTSLLVMDDLGAERDQATDFTRRTLLMIYEERCDRGLRTVFTSNKSIQELAEMQDDDRLASRIAGRADVLKINTNDQRLRRVK